MPPVRSVGLARRAARLEEPEGGLAAVAALRAHLEALEAQHVENALRAGLSWSAIATLLGVTKQAAHKKHAARLRARGGVDERRGSDVRALVVSNQAREAVAAARDEAASLGHRSFAPEHLLLGLLRDDRGPAVDALEAVGVSFAAARREVRRLYREEVPGANRARASRTPDVAISSRTRNTVVVAVEEAMRSGWGRLGVEHLLAALLEDSQGGAPQVLSALGVATAEVERELDRRIGRDSGTEPKEERATGDEAMSVLDASMHRAAPGPPSSEGGPEQGEVDKWAPVFRIQAEK